MSQKLHEDWSEVKELLEKMSIEQIEEFISAVEVLGKAKKAGMLFDNYENLQLLCPNCHALTDSWKGRNRKSRLDSDSKSGKMVKQKVH